VARSRPSRRSAPSAPSESRSAHRAWGSCCAISATTWRSRWAGCWSASSSPCCWPTASIRWRAGMHSASPRRTGTATSLSAAPRRTFSSSGPRMGRRWASSQCA